MKTIWNKHTGVAKQYDDVDAREILANSPDLYTDVDPNDGKAGGAEGGEGTTDALDDMTVAELRDYADTHDIDLGDATLKADILKKVKAAR